MDDLRLRSATPRDALIVAELIRRATASYADFAPPGWHGRTPFREEAEVREALSRDGGHARLALTPAGAAVGVTGWRPATTENATREPIPGRGHVWAVFVVPDWWGNGLAADLLDWTTTTMRDSGLREAQLWTPRGNARARAFYERRGWAVVAEREHFNEDLGLDLVFYERRL